MGRVPGSATCVHMQQQLWQEGVQTEGEATAERTVRAAWQGDPVMTCDNKTGEQRVEGTKESQRRK